MTTLIIRNMTNNTMYIIQDTYIHFYIQLKLY